MGVEPRSAALQADPLPLNANEAVAQSVPHTHPAGIEPRSAGLEADPLPLRPTGQLNLSVSLHQNCAHIRPKAPKQSDTMAGLDHTYRGPQHSLAFRSRPEFRV